MGSVSGLTAFSIVFLSLAMLVFWSVTDLEGNQAVQEQMLTFQAKEIANDIELVADYENEGFAEVGLDSNYTFEINSDSSYTTDNSISLSIGGVTRTADLNVEVENQNRDGGSKHQFSAKKLCIYTDYEQWDKTYYDNIEGDSFTPDPADTYLAEVYDPEDSDPNDGSVEDDDEYVQVYPGACKP